MVELVGVAAEHGEPACVLALDCTRALTSAWKFSLTPRFARLALCRNHLRFPMTPGQTKQSVADRSIAALVLGAPATGSQRTPNSVANNTCRFVMWVASSHERERAEGWFLVNAEPA